MNLVFMHKCGLECPANEMKVTISTSFGSNYYVIPEVRCVYTNNILSPVNTETPKVV